MADPLFDLANFSVNNELGAGRRRVDSAGITSGGSMTRGWRPSRSCSSCPSYARRCGACSRSPSPASGRLHRLRRGRGERFFSLLAGVDLARLTALAASAPPAGAAQLTQGAPSGAASGSPTGAGHPAPSGERWAPRRRAQDRTRSFRVEQRLGDDLGARPAAEDADLYAASGLGLARRAGRRTRWSGRRCSRIRRSSPARPLGRRGAPARSRARSSGGRRAPGRRGGGSAQPRLGDERSRP